MGGKSGSGRRHGAMEPGSARFLLRSFKRILLLNTEALERMAQMDRALGGEYVFDKAFLEAGVRDVCRLTHLAAYHVNGMAGEGWVELYDAFLAVKDALEDILAGGMGPMARRRVLSFAEIGWEMEPLVGLSSVGLAVLGRAMGLPAPDGLAVTVTGMAELAGPQRLDVLAEVEQAVRALFDRLGGPRPLEIRLEAAGTDSSGGTLATALAEDDGQAARAVADLAVAYGIGRPLAACLRPRLSGAVRGRLQTLAHDPNLPPAMLAVAGPSELQDRYWLSRSAPHDPLRTRLAVKPVDTPLPWGQALDPAGGNALRGSAWLTPERAAELVRLGLAAERPLGRPCILEWVFSEREGFVLTGLEPAEAAYPDWAVDGSDQAGDESGTDSLDALLVGGRIACGGVGAGPVHLVDEDTAPASVPLGSVGVARAASPALSRLVPRLGALLTEMGTPASHLATVVREHRVPAVFGLAGATGLEPGTLVTVDAEQVRVYRGVAEGLLRQAAMQDARLGSEPEYLALGRLLRHIRPLNLIDPQADDFLPGRCRTCHDIIHFAHEKAVEHLLAMGGAERGGLGEPRRLKEDCPFALGIVDVGGGLADQAGDVTLDQVLSLPLKAFLEGLLPLHMRRPGPARLGLGDILAGMGRTAQALSAPPGSAGLNLALAGADYANITLRLGYHFSVVDAVVSERPEHTFVYFRFAGGFADSERRTRRARFIGSVLERLGLRATSQGDLVVGKSRLLEAGQALEVLRVLGGLTAFTRQLDVELLSESDVERFSREFLDLCAVAVGADGAEGRP